MKVSVILGHPHTASPNHAIAETALVFNASNTPGEREMHAFGDPLQAL